MWGTLIVGAVVLGMIGLAVHNIYKERKAGKSCGCSCDSGSCGMSCHGGDSFKQ